MTLDTLIMFSGAFVAVLPFLGFPQSWDKVFFFLAGVFVIALGIAVRRRTDELFKGENGAKRPFVENHPSHGGSEHMQSERRDTNAVWPAREQTGAQTMPRMHTVRSVQSVQPITPTVPARITTPTPVVSAVSPITRSSKASAPRTRAPRRAKTAVTHESAQ